MTHGTGLLLAAGPNLEGFGAFFTHERKKVISLPFPGFFLFFFFNQTNPVFSSIGPTSHEWHLWCQPGPTNGNQHLLSGDPVSGLHWGPTSRHWCNWKWQLGALLLQQAQGVPAQTHRWAPSTITGDIPAPSAGQHFNGLMVNVTNQYQGKAPLTVPRAGSCSKQNNNYV